MTSKISKINRNILKEYVKESNSWTVLIYKCGYKCIGGANQQTIKKRLDKDNINYTHIDNCVTKYYKHKRNNISDMLKQNQKGISNVNLIKKLVKEKGWILMCNICKNKKWCDNNIPLELDHIDGNNTNYTLSNLRLLCSNCHSQTKTWGGRNKEKKKIHFNKKKRNTGSINPKLNTRTNKINKISKSIFKGYVKSSNTWKELLKKCGYNGCGCLPIIKKRMLELNLSLPTKNRYRQTLDGILVKNSKYKSYNLKNRLVNELYWENECSKCGIYKWNNKVITLQLDHINGIHSDNRIKNLRILCPNCHRQTDTWGCKGKKTKKIYNCIDCNKNISRKSVRCTECENKRRFLKNTNNRPSYKQIIKDWKGIGSYVGVGKKYSVSDSAVRKWIKKYKMYDLIDT